jgi:hypothetical protein
MPIDTFSRELKADDTGCTPHSPVAKWNWIFTEESGQIILAPGFAQAVTGTTNGCCLDGISVDCIANGIPESQWKKLTYTAAAYYNQEYLVFLEDGTFNGGMQEQTQNLDYSESNFCNNEAAYIHRINDYTFWGKYDFNSSTKKVVFSGIESTKREVCFESLGYCIDVYDRVFIKQGIEYEMLGCNFLIERSSVEGQGLTRVFERWDGGWQWLD